MTIRVIVVEDHAEFRESLSQLIQETPGLRCVGVFPDCEGIVEKVRRTAPDVVLMDIGLPGLSGIEGVRLIKAHFPEVEILMLTVYEDEKAIFDSLYAGASGYLLKKTPPARILQAIQEIHAGGAPMTARVARRVLQFFQQSATPAIPEADLTPRERDVLTALVQGEGYKQIARRFGISLDTVRSYIKHIYEKLHVHSKSQAVARALKDRLV
ncbi:Transcriptional regulatory protein LiaR [bacterium HR11]|nr:Transcriptional regulatory protein LiaR [bacterium HR11]